MRIEVQRASNLGQLHTNLGIEPDSRVSIGELGGNGQLEIWDLASGRYFTAMPFASPPSIRESYAEVPGWFQTIVTTSSDDLLAEFKSSWREGAGEKRMAIFTELCYRGVSVL